MASKIGLLFAGALVLTVVQAADIKRQFCVGEDGSKCPVQPSYGCPQDIHKGSTDIGREICTINTAEGTKVLDFNVVKISDTGGNKCGYTVFEVTCFRP